MNAPHALHQLKAPLAVQTADPATDEVNLVEYWDIVKDNRWLISAIAAASLAVGTTYALIARPVYETNLLIQVEDSSSSAKSFLGEAASLFDVKTPATAEIEILRSRMIIGQAVESTHLYIEAAPVYVPIVGNWLARRADSVSDPGVLGVGGWVSGTERISVTSFDVPPAYESTPFTVVVLDDGKFSLGHSDLERSVEGRVGIPLAFETAEGQIRLIVSGLDGKAGARFQVIRRSTDEVVENLQDTLRLSEKGRQSGIIDATLQHTDRYRLASILNEIGNQYVRQNVQRKAAEAQKTLAFLDVQLPQFKKQLDQSEEAYNTYRNRQGTVALDEEAKLVLGRSVEVQAKLAEARQKRLELISRFRPEHPNVVMLDSQIEEWNRELSTLNSRIKALPSVQQDAIRLERDVKVNNELYQQLKNNALQLQLIREGKIGNVRIIDSARVPREPVKPSKSLTLMLALMIGLVGGVVIALLRNALHRGVLSSQEIEAKTGLNVFSTIPLSEANQHLTRQVAAKESGIHLLAASVPQDAAIEALRSLRTALQFAMLGAENNRLLITGPTPGVGKSFVSVNFAAVVASSGKRVLLIDADLRKGHINQYFGLSRQVGLSELIAGTVGIEQAIRKTPVPNLDVIPTGVLPPNPAELLVSRSFGSLLESFSEEYDLVLIDSAPVLVAADTLSIASHAGTVLLVARASQTQIGELHESTRRFLHAGVSVSGVLFNGIDLRRHHYGRYGYRSGGYRYLAYKYESRSGV